MRGLRGLVHTYLGIGICVGRYICTRMFQVRADMYSDGSARLPEMDATHTRRRFYYDSCNSYDLCNLRAAMLSV